MKTTPLHQRLETPPETDSQELRDVNELMQHLIETWSALCNQQNFIDQAIDQQQDCFKACHKAKCNTEHLHNISPQVS